MQRRIRLLAAALAATTTLGLVPSAPSGAALPPAQQHTFGSAGQLASSELFTPPGATPIVGDFDDRQGDDLLWYTPGAGGDAFWSSNQDGTWAASAVSINGTYTPHVGQFGGSDKGDDILWYSTTGASQLWDYDADDGFELIKTSLASVTGTGTILTGDLTGDGATDVVRYRPGAQPEQWWDFDPPTTSAPALTNRSFSVNGTYTPIVGTFSRDPNQGDYGEDILWYAPGTAADTLWDFDWNGEIDPTSVAINGTFTPLVGRWMSSPHDQILWYAPGAAPDSVWSFTEAHVTVKKSLTINGTYVPATGSLVNSGLGDRDDILWHGVGNAPDALWSFNGPTFSPTSSSYPGTSIRGSKVALPALDGFAQAVVAYG